MEAHPRRSKTNSRGKAKLKCKLKEKVPDGTKENNFHKPALITAPLRTGP
jgi:hypothetical protein